MTLHGRGEDGFERDTVPAHLRVVRKGRRSTCELVDLGVTFYTLRRGCGDNTDSEQGLGSRAIL